MQEVENYRLPRCRDMNPLAAHMSGHMSHHRKLCSCRGLPYLPISNLSLPPFLTHKLGKCWNFKWEGCVWFYSKSVTLVSSRSMFVFLPIFVLHITPLTFWQATCFSNIIFHIAFLFSMILFSWNLCVMGNIAARSCRWPDETSHYWSTLYEVGYCYVFVFPVVQGTTENRNRPQRHRELTMDNQWLLGWASK